MVPIGNMRELLTDERAAMEAYKREFIEFMVESDVLKLLVYYILSLMSVNGPADSVLRAAFCHYPENYITLMEYYDPAEHGMEAYTRK